jgi:hypothetical protein
VNLRSHLIGESGVHEALSLESTLAFEAVRDDERAEMPSPGPGAGVTRVERALVHDLDVGGRKRVPQLLLDVQASIHRPARMREPAGLALYADVIGIERTLGSAGARLGSVTVSTPVLYTAFTASSSTSVPRRMARWKRPR